MKRKFKHDDVENTGITYGDLRRYAESCTTVHEWIEENLPETFEKKPLGNPIVVIYYPEKNRGTTIMSNHPDAEGWATRPAQEKELGLSFNPAGMRGWHVPSEKAKAHVNALLDLLGVRE